MQCPAKLTPALGAITYCLERTLGTSANNDLNAIHLSWTRRLVSPWRPRAPLKHTIKVCRQGPWGGCQVRSTTLHPLRLVFSTLPRGDRGVERRANVGDCVAARKSRLEPASIAGSLRPLPSQPAGRSPALFLGLFSEGVLNNTDPSEATCGCNMPPPKQLHVLREESTLASADGDPSSVCHRSTQQPPRGRQSCLLSQTQ